MVGYRFIKYAIRSAMSCLVIVFSMPSGMIDAPLLCISSMSFRKIVSLAPSPR